MDFGTVIDKFGVEIRPGDIVIYSDRGNVRLGVIHERAKNTGCPVVRVRSSIDKGKGNPWGNSRLKSLSIITSADGDKCYGLIRLDSLLDSDSFSSTEKLADYMEEKGKVGARVSKSKPTSIGFADNFLSQLGSPNIK